MSSPLTSSSSSASSSPSIPLRAVKLSDDEGTGDASSLKTNHALETMDEDGEPARGHNAGEDEEDADADADAEYDSDIASSRALSVSLVPSNPPESQDSNAEERVQQEPPSEKAQPPASFDLSASKTPQILVSQPSSSPTSWTSEPQLPKLSDAELSNAKHLVLDLLGWGVSPEYILQRGVSHQLLYTVFTDLRLRLPDAIVADCVALANRFSSTPAVACQ